MTRSLSRVLATVALLACGTAYAGTEGIAVSIGSRHSGSSTPCNGMKEYNESNPGLGFRFRRNEAFEFEVGVYKNSLAVESTYGSVTWLPYRKEHLELGFLAGIASGYCNNDSGMTATGALVANIWATKNIGIQLLGIPPISDITPGVAAVRVLVNF